MEKTDALFEFEKLKFEVEYLFKQLLTFPSEIDSFEYRIKKIENMMPERRNRADQIKSNLGK
jgi:predicted  nucleic acid-binding Zn-ribbon protein